MSWFKKKKKIPLTVWTLLMLNPLPILDEGQCIQPSLVVQGVGGGGGVWGINILFGESSFGRFSPFWSCSVSLPSPVVRMCEIPHQQEKPHNLACSNRHRSCTSHDDKLLMDNVEKKMHRYTKKESTENNKRVLSLLMISGWDYFLCLWLLFPCVCEIGKTKMAAAGWSCSEASAHFDPRRVNLYCWRQVALHWRLIKSERQIIIF